MIGLSATFTKTVCLPEFQKKKKIENTIFYRMQGVLKKFSFSQKTTVSSHNLVHLMC